MLWPAPPHRTAAPRTPLHGTQTASPPLPQGELIEVGISMKVPLDKVADNLPPPEKPLPVSAADARVSDYRGIGTRLSLWEDVAGSGPTEVC